MRIKTSYTHSPSMKSQLNLTEATWPQSNELKPWQASVGKVLLRHEKGGVWDIVSLIVTIKTSKNMKSLINRK